MNRRGFVTGMGALATALRASGASKIKRVAIFWLPFDRPSLAEDRREYESRFAAHGYRVGENLEVLWFEIVRTKPNATYEEIAARMVSAKPDCIIAGGIMAESLKKLTTTIPVVTLYDDMDPVDAGIARTIARPGGNFTGLYEAPNETWLKRMEIMKRLVPGISCVGWIAFDGQLHTFPSFEKAARTAGLRVQKIVAEVKDVPRFEQVRHEVAKLRSNGCAAAHFHSAVPSLVEAVTTPALESRLILSYTGSGARFRTDGLFFMYFPIMSAPGYNNDKRLVPIASRILNGERPGNIAFEGPAGFRLALNRRTATRIGVSIPADVLVRADEIID